MAKPTKPKDLKPEEGAAAGGGAPPAGGGGLDLKFIITILAIVLFSLGSSVGSIFFLGPMVLVPAIVEQLPKGEHGEEGEHGGEEGHGGGGHHASVGLNLELDEFTANLKRDPNARGTQYVRTKVSLSVGVPEAEDCMLLMAPHAATVPPPSKTLALKGGKTSLDTGVIAGAAAPLITSAAAPLTNLGTSPIQDITVDELKREIQQTHPELANGGGGPSPYDLCLTEFKHHMAVYVPTIRDVINTALMKRTAGNLESLEGQEALKDDIKDQINHLLGGERKVIRVNFQDFIIQR